MPIYAGRYNNQPLLALSTVDSEMFSNPPTANVVFRSDLPYIFTKTYYSSSISSTENTSAGTIRYFAIPNEVIAASINNNVVLFYFVNSSGSIFPVIPQINFLGYVGGDVNYAKAYRRIFAINPTLSKSMNIEVTGKVQGKVTNFYNSCIYNPGDSVIGTIIAEYTQLKCVVLDSLFFNGDSTIYNNTSAYKGNTANGVLISRTEFSVGGVDLKNIGILARYKNNNPLINDGYSTVNYPLPAMPKIDLNAGAVSYSFPAAGDGRYTKDSTASFTGEQFHHACGLNVNYGTAAHTSILTSTSASVNNTRIPVFGIQQVTGTTSVTMDSRTSSILFNGMPMFSPNIAALYNYNSSTTISVPSVTNRVDATIGTQAAFDRDILLTSASNIFANNVTGAGILTMTNLSAITYNINPGSSNSQWDYYVNIPAMAGRHSCLLSLNDGDSTLIYNGTIFYRVTYRTNRDSGINYKIYIKRVGNGIEIRAKVYRNVAWSGAASNLACHSIVILPAFSLTITSLSG